MGKSNSRRQQPSAPAPAPANGARPLSQREVDEAFNGPASAPSPASPFGDVNPSDLKGALLTNDRFIVYTTSEKRVGKKTSSYTVFRRGPITIGVFPEDAIVEEDIENIVSEAVPEMEAEEVGGEVASA